MVKTVKSPVSFSLEANELNNSYAQLSQWVGVGQVGLASSFHLGLISHLAHPGSRQGLGGAGGRGNRNETHPFVNRPVDDLQKGVFQMS
ncbi:MAG: hypothetical protein KA338_29185 [Chloroflexi bacterium]|nr:hypothetical protein [Chloroflexota bacterium]